MVHQLSSERLQPLDDLSPAVKSLRSVSAGEVFVAGDDGYDSARAVWNAMIDRRPAVIVRCKGAADVIAAIAFARNPHLPIAIRGGAHNVAGYAVCDNGVMIDLSTMRSVRVDPERRSAWVEGGAAWREVDRETQAFGLATPGGLISDPASLGSRSAVASAGCGAAMDCASTISSRRTSSQLTGTLSTPARAEFRPAMGAKGGWRQFWCRDNVRVRTSSRWSQGHVSRPDLSDHGGHRTNSLLARFSARQERRCGIAGRVLDHTARPDLPARGLGKTSLHPSRGPCRRCR